MWLSESWGEKNSKNVQWKDEVKAAVRKKDATWKKVLAASKEEAKEICMKVYRRKEKG